MAQHTLNRFPKGGMGRSLLLSGGILLLPLLLLFSQNLWEKKREIESLQQQLHLLEWVTPLYGALDQTSKYRGLRETSYYYPGHYDFAEEHLGTVEQQFEATLEQLHEMHKTLPANLSITTEVNLALHRIEELWLIQQGEQFSFIGMNDLIYHINNLIVRLLPERIGHQRILLQDIPELREVMAQLRGAGSGFLARASATTEEQVLRQNEESDPLLQRIERTMWDSENQFVRLRRSLEDEKSNLNEQTLAILIELVGEIQEVRDLVEWELIDSAIISLSPDLFFEEASEPIYLLHLLAMEIRTNIQQALQSKIDEKVLEGSWLVLLVTLALILSITVSFHNTWKLVKGVRRAVNQLQLIGSGDFEKHFTITNGQGEIRTLLESIQQAQQQLKSSYAQVESERLFSEGLTSSMEDGVYALDHTGRLVFMNRAAEQLLGWESRELLGKDFHDIIHAEQPDGNHISREECPTFKSITEGKSYFTDSGWFKKRSGAFIPIELSVAPLTTHHETNGSVAVFRDISERLELDRKLHTALENAQQASLIKDEFLASMSHELRTPLTAIIGNCEFLIEHEHEQKNRELIESIESAGRRQLALVNDILDLSKIESGKFTIEENPYNPNGLIQDLRQMFALRIHDAGLRFQIRQEQPFTHQLIGDIQRSGQILINLIGNAIKFTEQGSITLTIWNNDQQLYFSVADSGIGMPPEVQERLFKRFEQADSSISRRFGGSGLGLYISYHLARLMGGVIEVESKEGEGSTFTLQLPYRAGEPLTIESKPGGRSRKRTTETRLQGTVLIAEDTPELQLLERRILESMGLSVTTANNGTEAVSLAQNNHFDLILMDMQMPEMDGIEATRQIRAFNNEIPIIALTANVLQKHREVFAEAGGNGFIGKPIDRQELSETLIRFLENGSIR